MDPLLLSAQQDPAPWAAAASIFMLAACAAVWTLIFARKSRGLPVVVYQPRRQVPWNGLDVLVVFLVAYFLIPSLVWIGCAEAFDLKSPATETAPDTQETDVTHPLGRLLLEGDSLWIVALTVLVAVVVAPVFEEFLFRVVLQGWLEAIETRWRRRVPHLRALMRGSIAVTLSSLSFAALHFRRAAAPAPVDELAVQTAIFAVARLVALAAVIWFLWLRGARPADFGIVPRRILTDVKLGLLALLAITPPVHLLHWISGRILPKGVAPDPVPLFLLAIVLGVLCYRTRRVGSAIVLHMGFNGLTVLAALLQSTPK